MAKIIKNPTCNALVGEADARFRRYRGKPNGTLKIATFVTPIGTPFAIDTSTASKLPIWVPTSVASSSELSDVPQEAYPADRSRNSNLDVPGLKVGNALTRFTPRSLQEARRVLDHLAHR